jgi:RsiW-degrading membrane proteinase PrsW (M82 family)
MSDVAGRSYVGGRSFLSSFPVLATLVLAAVVALVAGGVVTGVIPSSDQGTLVPGHHNATSMVFSRWHLTGLVFSLPIGALLYLLGSHLTRTGPRWAGVVVGSGLTTIPLVVLVNNPRGVLLAVPGALLSVWVIRRLQGARRIPMASAAAAFGWGATCAVTLGLLLSMAHRVLLVGDPDAFSTVDPISATLPAPVWEELGKAVGVLVVFHHLKDRFDGLIGGLVVGAMVGAGFNFCETVRYAVTSLDVASYQVWVRQWVGGVFAGHALFTALTGAAVGVAVIRRTWLARIGIVVGAYALAVTGHFVWNLTVTLDTQPFDSADPLTELAVSVPLNYLTLSAPFIALVFGSLWIAQRREAKALRETLPVEAGSGLGEVRPAEVPVLLNPRLRLGYRIHWLRTGGVGSYVGARRLQLAQLDLGVERWRVARTPWRPSREAELRQRVRHARQQLLARPGAIR